MSLERACERICMRPVFRTKRIWFKEFCAVLSPIAKRSPSRSRARSYSALISLGRQDNEFSSFHSSLVSLTGLFLLLLGLSFAFMRLNMSMPLAKAETIDVTTTVTCAEDITIGRIAQRDQHGKGDVSNNCSEDKIQCTWEHTVRMWGNAFHIL